MTDALSHAGLLLLHLVLLIGVTPLVAGIVGWIRSRAAGRPGSPVLQPYRDLLDLARKQAVISEGALSLGLGAPYGVLACLLLALALIPGFSGDVLPTADFVVLVGLLAAARVIRQLGLADGADGQDWGRLSVASGLGPGALSEAALLMCGLALVLATGSTATADIAAAVAAGDVLFGSGSGPALAGYLLAMVGFGAYWIAEALPRAARTVSGAGPSDDGDPALRDWSARHLGLLRLTDMLHLTVLLALPVGLLMPWGSAGKGAAAGIGMAIAVYLAKLGVAAIVLGLLAAFAGGPRMASRRRLQLGALAAGGFGVLSVSLGQVA